MPKRQMTPEWAKRRKEIIARDGGKCRKCGRSTDLEVHHIHPKFEGGSDEPENLATLCAVCHVEWDVWEAGLVMAFDKWLTIPPLALLYAMYELAAQKPERAAGDLRAEIDQGHAALRRGAMNR